MLSKKHIGRVYTVAYLSERWNKSVSTIKRKIYLNELKAQKVGKTWLISHTVTKNYERKNIPPEIVRRFKEFLRTGKKIADIEHNGTASEQALLSQVATIVSISKRPSYDGF